ncbi:MAG: hypothetical protein CVT49_16305 [candidate division Zixibacteria bacterium HGW-Zixibacteria-1]|nr:MAG: hypothetical protein CVT49_16305 [candidate division Zixibacteria bacterium HGW-Zixibacteria-1]
MTDRIAIIGAGPAGIAAAIQLKRYGLESILFESHRVGGLIHNAWKIENYPGFPDGIPGVELAAAMKQQLDAANVVPHIERVRLLDYDSTKQIFLILTDQNEYEAEFIIAASGTKPKNIEILESLDERLKKNVYYEIAPILGAKDKTIVIIGAGDIAFDYALNLAEENKVVILNRSANSSALPLLKNLVSKNDHISYYENVDIIGIEETETGLMKLIFTGDGTASPIESDYILAAVGREPQDTYFSPELARISEELQRKGRLYMAGDIKNGIFRQVGIAVGDGLLAAMRIYRSLKENKSCV